MDNMLSLLLNCIYDTCQESIENRENVKKSQQNLKFGINAAKFTACL